VETSLRKTLFLVALTLSCAVSAKPAPNAGDVAVKPAVMCAIDFAHAPGADGCSDFESPEMRSRLQHSGSVSRCTKSGVIRTHQMSKHGFDIAAEEIIPCAELGDRCRALMLGPGQHVMPNLINFVPMLWSHQSISRKLAITS